MTSTQAVVGGVVLTLLACAVPSPVPPHLDAFEKRKVEQETCVFALLQDTVSPEVVEYCKTLLDD